MEMGSHDYTSSELHVAQQIRRDKLRGSSSFSDDFPINFHSPPVNVLPSEILNTGSFSSIHPTRFVLPSGSVENWSEGGGGGGYDNYQNSLQNWGNLQLQPSYHHHNHHQGLSLSLSPNNHQSCEIRGLGFLKPPLESANILPSQDVICVRNLGPLGPFMGYTTILKGSKFFKPAEQLLDEFINGAGLKKMMMTMTENSISSNYCSKSELSTGGNGNGNGYGGDESYRPDCHEKKVKLINMQEEVCIRQKQYHQEIQMVMSAFESVPGIANATPYISRSLKTLSRNFKSLKNSIANQLRYVKYILGEEELPSPVGSSISKGDNTSVRFGQNFTKVNKSSGFGGSGYQSHIWRPQRGLPERAVSVLRAWLFDHFLHPYPTDTDKQMLATQTGLSRNQVSNWFINARVRLWKPMVEEIHMLETKGVSKNNTEVGPNSNNRHHQDYDNNHPGFQPKQLESSGVTSSSSTQMQLNETSHRQITSSSGTELDGSSFVGFLPNYERQVTDRGAFVSLTLALRQGSETIHPFQQQGMHFGSHIYAAGNNAL